MSVSETAIRPSKTELEQRSEFFDRASQAAPVISVRLADGLRFLVDTTDRKLGRMLFTKLEWSGTRALLQASEEIRRDGFAAAHGTFLDVGSRSGIASLRAVSTAGFRDAIALDPAPDRVRLLRVNARLSGFADRIQAVNLGVGLDSGTTAFRPIADGWRSQRLAEGTARRETDLPVRFDTPDALVEDGTLDPGRLSLVWLGEVDGDQVSVLEQSTALLGAGVPLAVTLPAGMTNDAAVVARLDAFVDEFCSRVVQLGARRLADTVEPSLLRAALGEANAKRAVRILLIPATSKERRAGDSPPVAVTVASQAEPPSAGGIEYEHLASLRRQHLVAVDQPLVMISQPPRSGGTLMMRLFDGHPECHSIPHELRLAWRAIAETRGWEKLADRETLRSFFEVGFKQTKSRLNTERTLFPFLLPPSLNRELYELCLEQAGERTPRAVANAYMTAYFNAWLDNQNLYSAEPKKWITGFEPALVRRPEPIAHFSDVYPDGRMIFVLREPKSWFASARTWSVNHHKLEPAIEDWSSMVKRLPDLAERFGDRLVVVTFSDLVSRTEATMKAVARWLDISFVPALCVPTFNRLPIKANSSFPTESADVNEEPVERYRTVLSEAECEKVDSLASDVYEDAVSRFAIFVG